MKVNFLGLSNLAMLSLQRTGPMTANLLHTNCDDAHHAYNFEVETDTPEQLDTIVAFCDAVQNAPSPSTTATFTEYEPSASGGWASGTAAHIDGEVYEVSMWLGDESEEHKRIIAALTEGKSVESILEIRELNFRRNGKK